MQRIRGNGGHSPATDYYQNGDGEDENQAGGGRAEDERELLVDAGVILLYRPQRKVAEVKGHHLMAAISPQPSSPSVIV